ncbi:SdrD B-like domain-containing protein, partial [Staphylococcus epidermidis]|uniref:SdrD B-like domain-containing protein n=1 Tax=Staphylococcus epidermidis TaxID=1282 RepID=UPI0030BADAD6
FTPGAEESLSIQQAARMTPTDSYGYPQYSQYTNTVNSTSDSGGGDGTVAKTYKIGDYVWEDTDKDGVQGTDSNEKPIPGVLVTLTYP